MTVLIRPEAVIHTCTLSALDFWFNAAKRCNIENKKYREQ